MSDDDPMDVLAAIAPRIISSDDRVLAARARVDQMIADELAVVEPAAVPDAGSRRVVRRWWVGAAAAAVLAVVVVVWPTGTSDAFASWTPVPTTPTVAQLGTATQGCETALTKGVAQQLAAEQKTGVSFPHSPRSLDELAGRQVVIGEQRGDFTLVVSINATWLVECLAAPSVSASLTGTTVVDLRLAGAAVGTAGVDVLNLSQEGSDTTSAAVVYGRAGAGVVGVDLLTPDGRTITASVSGGYWSAWWPADPGHSAAAASITVHTVGGVSRRVGTVQGLLEAAGSGS